MFTFNTGELTLVPNTQYLLFVSASQYFDGSPGGGNLDARTSSSYSDGQRVFLSNGSNFNQIFTEPFTGASGGADLAFRANFTAAAVPFELSPGLGSLGLGVAGGISYFRSLKRKSYRSKFSKN